jgi:hypothetical protein
MFKQMTNSCVFWASQLRHCLIFFHQKFDGATVLVDSTLNQFYIYTILYKWDKFWQNYFMGSLSYLFVTVFFLWWPRFFFGGGRGSNHGPCIYYALSIPTELSSRGHLFVTVFFFVVAEVLFWWWPRFEPRTLHILCIVHTNWVKFTRTFICNS